MEFIIEHLDTFVIAIVAVILGYDRFRSGSSSLRKEISADYKERNEQLEAKIRSFGDELNKTNIEVARLTGIIQEKDKHIESLTKILQGRNPEMLELLKEISLSNIEIKRFMETMHRVLNQELTNQTKMMIEDQERAKRIDLATEQHKGNPIRLPYKKDTKIKK